MSSTSSNTFIGNLTGTATNATTATNTTNIATTLNNTTGTDVYPTFVTAAASSNQPANLSANLRYVPSTNNLFASTFTGSLTGTASNATNAANIATTLDNTTGTDAYPTFVLTSANGNKATTVSSNLKYNPNTNTLIATTFSGTASNATTASTATNVATTLNDSGSTAVYPIFVTSPSTSSSQAIGVDSGLSFIPTTNALTASAMKTSSLDTATGTGTLTIGVSGNTTELKSGNLNIQNDATIAGTVNIKCGSTSTGNINMKTGATSGGAVNIATGTGATQTTTVSIGSGSTTGTVTIGNSANLTSINSNNVTISSNSGTTNMYGGTNCGRSTSTTPNTFIEMFSGSPNAVIDFHSGGVVDNDFDCRIVSFGGSSSTNPALWNGKGLLELTASPIQMNGTLLMKDSYNISLPNGAVAPTSGQLGYLKAGTMLASTTTINNGNTNLGSLALDPGSWIINAYCGVNASGLTTTNFGFRYSISTTSGGAVSTDYLLIGTEGTNYTLTSTCPTLAGTAMVSITTATTFYLNLNLTYSAGSATLGTVTHWNAMRIG